MRGFIAGLAPAGVKVLLIEPGAIATPIWSQGTTAGEQLTAPAATLERYDAMLAAARKMALSSETRHK